MPEKGTLHATIRWELVSGDFPPTWAGGGGGGSEVFRGEVESLWCVFEWKYMMYCVSLCKLKFVFPCVNVHVISIQGSP